MIQSLRFKLCNIPSSFSTAFWASSWYLYLTNAKPLESPVLKITYIIITPACHTNRKPEIKQGQRLYYNYNKDTSISSFLLGKKKKKAH